MHNPTVYSQQMSPLTLIVTLALMILLTVSNWKIFVKAGEPGWKAIIPFYNAYTQFKFSVGNGWMFLTMYVPYFLMTIFTNLMNSNPDSLIFPILVIVAAIITVISSIWVTVNMCKHFGKGIGFAIGAILLSFIFYPILAFGSAQYSEEI